MFCRISERAEAHAAKTAMRMSAFHLERSRACVFMAMTIACAGRNCQYAQLAANFSRQRAVP